MRIQSFASLATIAAANSQRKTEVEDGNFDVDNIEVIVRELDWVDLVKFEDEVLAYGDGLEFTVKP